MPRAQLGFVASSLCRIFVASESQTPMPTPVATCKLACQAEFSASKPAEHAFGSEQPASDEHNHKQGVQEGGRAECVCGGGGRY